MRCNNQLFFFKVQDHEPLAYNNDSSGWKILIHDQRNSPLIHLRTLGTTLYRGWSKDIRVFIRQVPPANDYLHFIKLFVFKFIILQFRTINSDKRPCSDDMNYSYSECVANCFTTEVNANGICRLPFINGNKSTCIN